MNNHPLIGKYFPVLDHGFVALVDYMGDDAAIVQAAHTSYGFGTKSRADERALIRYLQRHRHTTPSEMGELKFHVRLPIFVARQLVRHRTASLNEQSLRYSLAPLQFYMPEYEVVRKQSTTNKQGREQQLVREVYDRIKVLWETGRERDSVVYVACLEQEIARELARIDLPLSVYCYDEQTEVLTRSGFKLWRDVRESDELGVWDAACDTLCYERPERLTVQEHSGEMYRVDHRGVDLLVTPHHKMWVSLEAPPSIPRFELVPADVLKDRSLVRYNKLAPLTRPGPDPMPAAFKRPCLTEQRRSMLRLVGFFVGDGHASMSERNALTFTLRKKRKIAYLSSLCDELGFVCELRSGQHYVVRWEGSTQLFREMFYDATTREKRIPDWVMALGQDDADCVLDGLCSSDGHRYGQGGSCEFVTTSKQVAECTVRLGIHAGRGMNGPLCTKEATAKERARWSVRVFSRRSERPVINQMNRNTSLEHYEGKVYCAKTRTGVLVVRRNGCVVLSGNTEWYWKCDLHNLLGFLKLRADSHAQWEIQEYARVKGGIVKALFPLSFEAWIDYSFGARTLSRMDLNLVRQIVQGKLDWESRDWDMSSHGLTKREATELYATLFDELPPLPSFELDMASAKTAKHFYQEAEQAVPKLAVRP